jgi:hypothetical protein
MYVYVSMGDFLANFVELPKKSKRRARYNVQFPSVPSLK